MSLQFSAILAGGRNRRFAGEPKAFALLGGVPIIVRIREVLEAMGAEPHLITNSPTEYALLDLPMRSDDIRGRGPASGLCTALRWAAELNREHALCVACDMPFLSGDLMRELIDRAFASSAEVVVPESPGPLGIEPLCAVYSTRALLKLESAARTGGVSLHGLLASMDTERMPLLQVRRYGDPRKIFMNVNTQDQLAQAAELLTEAQRDAPHVPG